MIFSSFITMHSAKGDDFIYVLNRALNELFAENYFTMYLCFMFFFFFWRVRVRVRNWQYIILKSHVFYKYGYIYMLQTEIYPQSHLTSRYSVHCSPDRCKVYFVGHLRAKDSMALEGFLIPWSSDSPRLLDSVNTSAVAIRATSSNAETTTRETSNLVKRRRRRLGERARREQGTLPPFAVSSRMSIVLTVCGRTHCNVAIDD